ncbi:hypothetical protein [Sorangium sp. So ce388]|uniref:hypothetical protein n=1 Tax=Sorangium sp. So ce388 TaxID=3133309 RepID=UPI003F5BF104
MNIRPFPKPLPGEHVLGVDPKLLPNVDAARLRRPNLYTGRALSEAALATEQLERAARLAFRGQAVSAGVLAGLDVQIEALPTGDVLHVGPGAGLAVTGEDVMVPRLVKAPVASLIAFAPATTGVTGDEPVYQQVMSDAGAPLTLAEIRADAARAALLTPALFLVLQPVVAAIEDDVDPTDPAPQDPEAYAYADVQTVDGCRLALCTWPTAWLPLPPPNLSAWRNRLAAALFERERLLGARSAMPWEAVGVPIALVAFDPSGRVVVVDRAAVARAGGAPLPRTPPVPGRGGPRLWQARIGQLAEHLAAIDPAKLQAGDLADDLRYLPPVGLLPRAALDVIDWQPRFFPPNFTVQAVPIPIEQLDAAIAASASLDPFDMNAFERVRVLVPVPEEDFEPALLDLRTTIDPKFEGAERRALARLARLLEHRVDVRLKLNALLDVIEGRRPYRFPIVDAAAVPGEKASTDDLASNPEQAFGTVVKQYVPPPPEQPDDPELRVAAVDELFQTWPDGRWESLGFSPTGNPVVMSNAQGVVYVFVRGSDGAIWWRRSSDGAWQPWQAIATGSVPLDVPSRSGGFAVASWGPERIDVFTRPEAPGQIVHRWLNISATAPVWGGELISASIDSDPVAVVSNAKRIDVFFRGVDGFIWQVATRPDGTLGAPASLGGLRTTGGVAAASWGAGRIDVFAAHVTSVGAVRLLHKWFTGNAWSEETFGGPVVGDPAVVAWGGGHLDVFINKGNVITQLTFDGAWQQRSLGAIRHAKAVHASTWGPGRLDLLIRDYENVLWHRWFDAAGWHDWQPIGDGANTEPVGVSSGVGHLDVVVGRKDGVLWHRSKLPDVAFGPLATTGLPGVVAAFRALVDKVEDTVNLGFVRAQAAIYRLRQQVLSSSGASRLATSPVLADIAKGESAVATKENVASYLNRAKTTPVDRSVVIVRSAVQGKLFTSPELLPESVMPSLTVSASVGDDQSAAVVKVRGQLPLPGATPIERTLSIAERLAQPAAVEIWQFALSTKYEVLKALASLDIDVSGIIVPGIELPRSEPGVATTPTGREQIDLATLRNPAARERLLRDPHPSDSDESSYFARAVELVEHAVVALRAVEGRVEAYRGLGGLVQRTLDAVSDFAGAADMRLKELGDQIAEARQDIVVARSLLAEEKARVERVVARRRAVLAQRVPFFAFQRPRQADGFIEAPVRALEPAAADAVVPAALASAVASPTELHAMVELMREAPVKWFTGVPAIFRLLDRLEALQRTVFAARERAAARSLFSLAARPSGLLGQGIARAFSAQTDVIAGVRRAAARIDPDALAALSWGESQQHAADVVSIGDLIDAGHGRADVARRAASELENIQKVATALYLRFGAVEPAIRLVWAEQASQYDAPIDLRQLARLPAWERIAPLDRREMQALASWLFSRVDAAQPSAVALMNDVVRVALLLASHAPVSEIISGHVAKPATVAAGGTVDVAVDVRKIRVNMHVMLDALEGAAHAIVEDIAAGVARVRVLSLGAGVRSVQLSTSTTVRFAEPERGGVLFKSLARRG